MDKHDLFMWSVVVFVTIYAVGAIVFSIFSIYMALTDTNTQGKIFCEQKGMKYYDSFMSDENFIRPRCIDHNNQLQEFIVQKAVVN